MNITSVKLVYFSPTGTTKKVLEGIAQGIGIESIEQIEMTSPQATETPLSGFRDELVLIGAPVYAGRLPADAIKRFKMLKAEKTPAVIVVLYGNREYDDALLELADLSRSLGFVPISGGAFIGEHSYSTTEQPIAPGRPDEKDIEAAVAFGAAVKQKISAASSIDDFAALEVPGQYPYKEMPKHPAVPNTLDEICTLCGTCAEVCPKGAITLSSSVETDPELCIKCCACVKECPDHARVMDDPFIKQVVTWLTENCSQRKEPEVFL